MQPRANIHLRNRGFICFVEKLANSKVIAIFCGMLLLYLVVVILVVVRMPDFPSGPTLMPWFKMHQSMYYFNVAKLLTKPLVKDPVEKWSRQLLDPGTGCKEIDNGVWHANGTVVTISSEGVRSRQPWSIYFEPEPAKLLFCKVGAVESGNLAQALKLAQLKPSSRETSP